MLHSYKYIEKPLKPNFKDKHSIHKNKKPKKYFPSFSTLQKKGFTYSIIVGLFIAHLLGWDAKALNAVKNYHELRNLFPASGIVDEIYDGDTFVLRNGLVIRLIGINTPDVGQPNYQNAQNKLADLVLNKKVYLEYDRYQEDKFTRSLAWVWIDCEKNPKFLPEDYMHKSDNESNPGLTENPTGCKKGKLVNEEMVKSGLASPTFYEDRGELKYQKRLNSH